MASDPLDRGAWRTMIHRVAKSWTRLKGLSTYACIAPLDISAWPRVSHLLSAALSHHSTASNNEELIRSFNCVWKLGGLGAV